MRSFWYVNQPPLRTSYMYTVEEHRIANLRSLVRAGWGALCVGRWTCVHSYLLRRCRLLTRTHGFTAGGGAYYFAKKSINADRQARLEESRKKRQMIDSLEYSKNVPANPFSASTMGGSSGSGTATPARTDPSGSPSQEASGDPAPTRHAPTTEGQRVVEKSKYESNTPYKSPKGDRFS